MQLAERPAMAIPRIDPDALMTVSETAARLHVDEETVRRWIRKGFFKRIVRVGPFKSIRLYAAEVELHRQESSR